MKKMIFNLLQVSSAMKGKVLAFAVLFLMGMGTISAQYVDGNEALVTIKGEVSVLLDAEANTNNAGLLSTIRFKKNYYLMVSQNIENGQSVQDAIHSNLPQGKPVVVNGWTTLSADANFRTELADLVTEAEGLLTE